MPTASDPFTSKHLRQWRERIEWLQETFPTSKPVRVQRLARMATGDCLECETYFRIRVPRRERYGIAVDWLHHEWAHALEWNDGEPDHSDAWGVAYATIYRADDAREAGIQFD